MTITKAMNQLIFFLNSYGNEKYISKQHTQEAFVLFLSKKFNPHKIETIFLKLHIAMSKGFINWVEYFDTISQNIIITSVFANYVVDQEKGKQKFLYGLWGSIITIVGGLIGALITAFI